MLNIVIGYKLKNNSNSIDVKNKVTKIYIDYKKFKVVFSIKSSYCDEYKC